MASTLKLKSRFNFCIKCKVTKSTSRVLWILLSVFLNQTMSDRILCLSVHLCVCLLVIYVCLSVCLFVISAYLSICLSVCLEVIYVCLSVCLIVIYVPLSVFWWSMSLCLSSGDLCPSVCPSVCLCVSDLCPSVCPSVCLCVSDICPSVCLYPSVPCLFYLSLHFISITQWSVCFVVVYLFNPMGVSEYHLSCLLVCVWILSIFLVF